MKRPCIKSNPIVVYSPIMHKLVWWFLHTIRSHGSPRTDEKCAYNLSLPLASSDVSSSMANGVFEKSLCRNCHTSFTPGWQNKPAHSASEEVLASAIGGISCQGNISKPQTKKQCCGPRTHIANKIMLRGKTPPGRHSEGGPATVNCDPSPKPLPNKFTGGAPNFRTVRI